MSRFAILLVVVCLVGIAAAQIPGVPLNPTDIVNAAGDTVQKVAGAVNGAVNDATGDLNGVKGEDSQGVPHPADIGAILKKVKELVATIAAALQEILQGGKKN